MRLESRAQAIAYRDQCLENIAQETCRILICGGTGCLAGGAGVLYQKLAEDFLNQVKAANAKQRRSKLRFRACRGDRG